MATWRHRRFAAPKRLSSMHPDTLGKPPSVRRRCWTSTSAACMDSEAGPLALGVMIQISAGDP